MGVPVRAMEAWGAEI